jgi:hypothetical protein
MFFNQSQRSPHIHLTRLTPRPVAVLVLVMYSCKHLHWNIILGSDIFIFNDGSLVYVLNTLLRTIHNILFVGSAIIGALVKWGWRLPYAPCYC